MDKRGRGLGYEIVKAVNNGEIVEPITYEKVKELCKRNDPNYSDKYLRVILPNSASDTHSPTYVKYFLRVGEGEYELHPDYRKGGKYY